MTFSFAQPASSGAGAPGSGFSFGAGAGAAPAFGASTSAGAGTPGGSLFGNVPSTPVVGTNPAGPQPSTAGTLFGTGAAAAPTGGGLFGSSTAAAPSSSGFSFGAGAATTSAAPASGGLFGAPGTLGAGATTTGGSLFGGGAAAAPAGGGLGQPGGGAGAAGGGLFGGGAAAAPSPGGGMFGASQPSTSGVPHGALLGAQGPAGADVSTLSELASILAAVTCSPENRDYKLRDLFLNVVGDAGARVKPATVDERQWQEALAAAGGEENPDRLWPVPAVGFRDLRRRLEAQKGAEREDLGRLANVRGLLQRMQQLRAAEVRQRLEAALRRHAEQVYRLLRLFRCLDGLEGALSVHGATEANHAAVRDLQSRLSAIEHSLGPASSSSLLGRASAAANLSRARARAQGSAAAALKDAQRHVRPEVLEEAFAVLSGQLEAIRKLQDVLTKDERDMALIGEELTKGASTA